MKTTIKLSIWAVLLSVGSAFAQSSVVPKNFGKAKDYRNEIIIPNVGGYNVYKADLHTHTFHSDGDVSPALRVEAWILSPSPTIWSIAVSSASYIR